VIDLFTHLKDSVDKNEWSRFVKLRICYLIGVF
jgi:hypothetical protein